MLNFDEELLFPKSQDQSFWLQKYPRNYSTQ